VIVKTAAEVSRSSDGRRAGAHEYEPQRRCSFQHARALQEDVSRRDDRDQGSKAAHDRENEQDDHQGARRL
jgi:hypothetical protein